MSRPRTVPSAIFARRQVLDTSPGQVPSFRGELAPIAQMAARLDEAAVDSGRDPGLIRRVLNVAGAVTEGASEGMFRGPVEQWVNDLTRLVGHGFDTFVLWPEGPAQLARFLSTY